MNSVGEILSEIMIILNLSRILLRKLVKLILKVTFMKRNMGTYIMTFLRNIKVKPLSLCLI